MSQCNEMSASNLSLQIYPSAHKRLFGALQNEPKKIMRAAKLSNRVGNMRKAAWVEFRGWWWLKGIKIDTQPNERLRAILCKRPALYKKFLQSKVILEFYPFRVNFVDKDCLFTRKPNYGFHIFFGPWTFLEQYSIKVRIEFIVAGFWRVWRWRIS